jgi:hypothetical protein
MPAVLPCADLRRVPLLIPRARGADPLLKERPPPLLMGLCSDCAKRSGARVQLGAFALLRGISMSPARFEPFPLHAQQQAYTTTECQGKNLFHLNSNSLPRQNRSVIWKVILNSLEFFDSSIVLERMLSVVNIGTIGALAQLALAVLPGSAVLERQGPWRGARACSCARASQTGRSPRASVVVQCRPLAGAAEAPAHRAAASQTNWGARRADREPLSIRPIQLPGPGKQPRQSRRMST